MQSNQRVLIYGTRANPLSFFLSRSLNLRLSANNVFCIDTVQTKDQVRLIPMRDVYSCNELPVLEDSSQLESIIQENQITDVVDMTNRDCESRLASLSSGEESDSEQSSKGLGLPADVRIFAPKFSTPTIIRQMR